MERTDERDVLELGVATIETRGVAGMIPDWANGQDPQGISDD